MRDGGFAGHTLICSVDLPTNVGDQIASYAIYSEWDIWCVPRRRKTPYFWFAGPRYGLHVSVQVPGDADRRPRVTSLAATLEFMVTLIERADLVGGGWRRLFISLLCRILCIGAGTWGHGTTSIYIAVHFTAHRRALSVLQSTHFFSGSGLPLYQLKFEPPLMFSCRTGA